MQAKRSTTQLELFNDSPLDETSLFHDPGRPAMANPRQRSYRLDLLPQVLAALDRHNDTYISQAEFFKPNRRPCQPVAAGPGLCRSGYLPNEVGLADPGGSEPVGSDVPAR